MGAEPSASPITRMTAASVTVVINVKRRRIRCRGSRSTDECQAIIASEHQKTALGVDRGGDGLGTEGRQPVMVTAQLTHPQRQLPHRNDHHVLRKRHQTCDQRAALLHCPSL